MSRRYWQKANYKKIIFLIQILKYNDFEYYNKSEEKSESYLERKKEKSIVKDIKDMGIEQSRKEIK